MKEQYLNIKAKNAAFITKLKKRLTVAEEGNRVL